MEYPLRSPAQGCIRGVDGDPRAGWISVPSTVAQAATAAGARTEIDRSASTATPATTARAYPRRTTRARAQASRGSAHGYVHTANHEPRGQPQAHSQGWLRSVPARAPRA